MKNHRVHLAVILAFILLNFAPQIFAEISAFDCNDKVCNLIVFGEIKMSDSEITKMLIKRIHQDHPNVGFILYVDSTGGSLDAALLIGRLARKNHMLVKVSEESACMSSCVYILAGGVVRIIEGQVGIHAPYFPAETDASYEINQAKYDLLKSKVEAYLMEMNMPTSLYDDMLRIPSHDVKVLTEEDLDKYGLLSDDPVFRETKEIQQAKKLGITRAEYIKRTQLSKKVCLPLAHKGDIGGWSECNSTIMEFE